MSDAVLEILEDITVREDNASPVVEVAHSHGSGATLKRTRVVYLSSSDEDEENNNGAPRRVVSEEVVAEEETLLELKKEAEAQERSRPEVDGIPFPQREDDGGIAFMEDLHVTAESEEEAPKPKRQKRLVTVIPVEEMKRIARRPVVFFPEQEGEEEEGSPSAEVRLQPAEVDEEGNVLTVQCAGGYTLTANEADYQDEEGEEAPAEEEEEEDEEEEEEALDALVVCAVCERLVECCQSPELDPNIAKAAEKFTAEVQPLLTAVQEASITCEELAQRVEWPLKRFMRIYKSVYRPRDEPIIIDGQRMDL
ncbi:hypothetical protein AGDE_12929 [Angomonas deanei]|uniref:Uncharacterized protein n=1 Tax=Angomonas deanei TaxID=59799 RepID=A0A7G2CFZ9_9TRYP|nr:hypothetical protein AGDE_12929 [Angomonas deanei]CAD2218760.1 hypothetical protein, conserved [Angomonas deanei]|eukprot:EPY23238.1 hypothetical protein AGDE_12929 [Angomonas deanei]